MVNADLEMDSQANFDFEQQEKSDADLFATGRSYTVRREFMTRIASYVALPDFSLHHHLYQQIKVPQIKNFQVSQSNDFLDDESDNPYGSSFDILRSKKGRKRCRFCLISIIVILLLATTGVLLAKYLFNLF